MTADNFFTTLNTVVSTVQQRGYSSELIGRVLSDRGLAAANSRNYAAAAWYARTEKATSTTEIDLAVVLGCYLREPLSSTKWDEIFGAELAGKMHSHGIISDGRLQVDIRPISATVHGDVEILLVSDPDAAAEVHKTDSNHVPGAGNASMSLLNVVPPLSAAAQEQAPSEVTEILDLGCGSGVLSLLLESNSPSVRVTGTDISQRALAFARLGRAGTARGVEPNNVEWLHGSWFEPVRGRTFDVVVSNPPFVMAPPARDETKTYRESGLELDSASALVVGEAATYLRPRGRAHLLAGWALADGESAAQRISGWLPSTGVRAWVVQREIVNVAEYVNTWLSDEGVDTRSTEGRARVEEWLNYLAGHGVSHIGMGYVHLEKLDEDQATEMTFEVLDQPLPAGTYLGYEVAEWFERAEWLAHIDREQLLDSAFAVRPSVAIERVEVTDSEQGQGFKELAVRLSRTEGPAWTHEIDSHVRAIISGLNPQGLPLRDVVELYCAVQGLDEALFSDALIPIITDLIRHGFVLPADLLTVIEEE
ncbi:methyltransferase [Corynebacterium resistens]|uniref:DUF7782 domain-containing protein n=1 Tax=Corynebacterium resistens TaxID=258224 RepID=UPI0023564BC0|nr:methyltransferase [Corynebacterium resistens]